MGGPAGPGDHESRERRRRSRTHGEPEVPEPAEQPDGEGHTEESQKVGCLAEAQSAQRKAPLTFIFSLRRATC